MGGNISETPIEWRRFCAALDQVRPVEVVNFADARAAAELKRKCRPAEPQRAMQAARHLEAAGRHGSSIVSKVASLFDLALAGDKAKVVLDSR